MNIRTFKKILPAIIASSCFTLGNGFFMPFMSLRLKLENFSTDFIGFITSVFFLGLFLGSFFVNKIIERKGICKAYFLFITMDISCLLLQAYSFNIYLWIILRLLEGICISGFIISIESWLLLNSNLKNKGKILSYYKFLTYLFLGISQFFLNVGDIRTNIHFFITASCVAISFIPIFLFRKSSPKILKKSNIKFSEFLKTSPMGILAGFIAGCTLGSIYGLLPIFAKNQNMSIFEISKVMRLALFGSLLFQLPIGFLSDRFNRKKILFITSLINILVCFIFLQKQIPQALFFPSILIFGGFSFIIYPLSMSISSDSSGETNQVKSASVIMTMYALGAIIGPLIASFLMQHISSKMLFYYFASLNLLLATSYLIFANKSKRIDVTINP